MNEFMQIISYTLALLWIVVFGIFLTGATLHPITIGFALIMTSYHFYKDGNKYNND